MMRKLKNSLAILIAFIMVMSMVSIPAFAEVSEDVQAVADAITAEMLTADNEPAHLVTKNLDMSLDGDIELPEGVTVTFASGDTDTVANDGTVTRNSSFDIDVTVTATVSKDGSDSVTKELNYTILKSSTIVHMSDNFYYPEYKDKVVSPTTSGRNWLLDGWAYPYDTVYTEEVSAPTEENPDATETVTKQKETASIKNVDGNYSLQVQRHANTGFQYFVPKHTVGITTDQNKITYSMTFNPASFGDKTVAYYIELHGKDSEGKDTMLIKANLYTASADVYTVDGTIHNSMQGYNLSVNKDNKVDIELDFVSGTAKFCINGTYGANKTLGGNTFAISMPEGGYTEKLSFLYFGSFYSNTNTIWDIRDVAVITDDSSEITYDKISSQSPHAIVSNLTLPTVAGGKTVTWKSSNTSVIATDGTVTRASVDTPVTLTATVEGVSTPYTFDVTVLSNRVDTTNINLVYNNGVYFISEPFDAVDGYKKIWGEASGYDVGVEGAEKDTALSQRQRYVTKADGTVTRALYLERTDNVDATLNANWGRGFGTAPNWQTCFYNGLVTADAELCFDFDPETETPVYTVNTAARGSAQQVANLRFDYANGNIYYNNQVVSTALPSANTWFRFTAVHNTLTETVTYYINGSEICTGTLLNSGIFDYYGKSGAGLSSVYYNCNTANAGMYIDNASIYALNDDKLKAESALQEVIKASVVTGDGGKAIDTSDTNKFSAGYSGIAIDWTVVSGPVTVNDDETLTVSKCGEATLTVKATSNSEVVEKTVTLNAAPVVIEGYNVSGYSYNGLLRNVTLRGDVEGKKLIIAIFRGNQLETIVPAPAELTEGINAIGYSFPSNISGTTMKAYVIDTAEGKLMPASYMNQYN